MKPLLQRDPSQSDALAAGLRARRVRRREAEARSAHAALRAVRAGHRAPGGAPESRHGIGGGQDGGCGRRPAQRHAGKPDRTGHRACGPERRAIHAREGVHRRRDRHQHAVHAGRVVSPRRTQAPRAGIQPGQRPHAGGPALPGHDRDVDSFGDLGSRLRGSRGIHPEVERGPGGAAHRGLRTGHAVLAQDAHASSSPARNTARRAKRRGRSAWPWPRSPASRCWWRWSPRCSSSRCRRRRRNSG